MEGGGPDLPERSTDPIVPAVTMAYQTSQHPPSVSRRAKEFYRYFDPHDVSILRGSRANDTSQPGSEHIEKLVRSATLFCQLAAIRCRARKAMLSFMDRDTMYILAEAYRNEALNDLDSSTEFGVDPVLSSCSSMPLRDRVCEMTLEVHPDEFAGRIPIYEIPDMSKSRFSNIAVVSGQPYYKYYAGIPIRNSNNVNIGSLSLMDTQPRDGLAPSESTMLSETADSIMHLLETSRQSILSSRAERMTHCMEAFTAGHGKLSEHLRSEKPVDKQSNGVSSERKPPPPSTERCGSPKACSQSPTGKESTSDSESASVDAQEGEMPRSHTILFARAANLLREGLADLGFEGSVTFVSAKGGLFRTNTGDGQPFSQADATSLSAVQRFETSKTGSAASESTSILAASSLNTPFHLKGAPSERTIGVHVDMLHVLSRRHPTGKIWSLNEDLGYSSEESEDDQVHDVRPASERLADERRALQSAFPGVQQLLFNPLWNSQFGSVAYGVFISRSAGSPILDPVTDLGFVRSFCGILMAECSRLDVLRAAKQKDDFVGTISHEMRSPLHGILASTDFLSETNMDEFQRSLLDSVKQCGKTLLDTINHVLDYSKVNAFQARRQSAKTRLDHKKAQRTRQGSPGSMASKEMGIAPFSELTEVVNIAVLLEDVVDGLLLGQRYESDLEIAYASRQKPTVGRSRTARSSARSENDVGVTLDVQCSDWKFVVQPGAIRRIMQNLIGNSLKFCPRGHTTAKLNLTEDNTDRPGAKRIVLTIRDTGCGISTKFLNTRLFLPFSQEDPLAPGTGLGLSTVYGIVSMLGGHIQIDSRLGEGTTVQVTLPLQRPTESGTPTLRKENSDQTIPSTDSGPDEPSKVLERYCNVARIALYMADTLPPGNQNFQTLKHYITDWFDLKAVEWPPESEAANVVIVDEEDVTSLLEHPVFSTANQPALLLLCSVSMRQNATFIEMLRDRVGSPIDFVAKPCGPYKLCRSLRKLLDAHDGTQPSAVHVSQPNAVEQAPATEGAESAALAGVGGYFGGRDPSDANGSDGPALPSDTKVMAPPASIEDEQRSIGSFGQETARNATGSSHRTSPMSTSSRIPSFSTSGVFAKQTEAWQAQSEMVGGHARTLDSPGNGIAELQPRRVEDVRILMVEDNLINMKLLEVFLKNKRHYVNISKAVNGKEAVDAVMAATQPFDIIFMDISMPIMNGFEATRAIRQHEAVCDPPNRTLIIALTGLASANDQSEGTKSGCDLYMTKPVSFKKLGKLLDDWEKGGVVVG